MVIQHDFYKSKFHQLLIWKYSHLNQTELRLKIASALQPAFRLTLRKTDIVIQWTWVPNSKSAGQVTPAVVSPGRSLATEFAQQLDLALRVDVPTPAPPSRAWSRGLSWGPGPGEEAPGVRRSVPGPAYWLAWGGQAAGGFPDAGLGWPGQQAASSPGSSPGSSGRGWGVGGWGGHDQQSPSSSGFRASGRH